MAFYRRRHEIFLIRHGESMGNVEKAFLDPDQDVLSDMGKLQVEHLGKYLQNENLTRIYSSDYSRAYDTAKAIAKHNKANLLIKTDERLRERNCGVYEGKSYEEAILAVASSQKPIMEYEPPQGEKIKELSARLNHFFKELFGELDKSDEQEVVAIISHSFAIMKFLEILTTSGKYKVKGWDQTKGYKLIRNASFIKIGVDAQQETCEDMNTLPPRRQIDFLKLHELEHLNTLEQNDTLVKLIHSSEQAHQYSGCIHSLQ